MGQFLGLVRGYLLASERRLKTGSDLDVFGQINAVSPNCGLAQIEADRRGISAI